MLFLSCWHWVRPLADYKIFLLTPDFKQFDYAVLQHNFVGLVFSVLFLNIYVLKVFIKFGHFSAIISSSIFFCPLFLHWNLQLHERETILNCSELPTVLFTYFQSCFLSFTLDSFYFLKIFLNLFLNFLYKRIHSRPHLSLLWITLFMLDLSTRLCFSEHLLSVSDMQT